MSLKKIGLVLLTGAATLSLSACQVGEAKVSQTDDDDRAAVSALPIDVVLPKQADIFATYLTTTTISSDADAAVIARVGGELVEILVEEGELVDQGQVLARLDGDRLRLQMLQAKAKLERVTKEYERSVRLHQKGLVSASDYEGLRFDMDALNAAYKLKRLDFEYSMIRAPIAGVVSSREVKLGQHVRANDVTFKITDTTKLVAYLTIPQTELAKFSAGIQAELRVDAMPEQTFTATIARISPTIDARTGTFRATAYIDNNAGLIAPGMFGRFNIAYEKHSDALVVPLSAVVREDGESVVYIVENGLAVRRVIKAGIETDSSLEILDGLDGHEQVVITGQGSLRDGSRIFANVVAEWPLAG